MSFLAQFRPQPAAELNGSRGERPFSWTDFTGGGLGYAEAALAREVDEVVRAPQGQRNHTLNAAAFSLGQLVAGGALSQERVVDALLGGARSAGLTRLESERTITSGLRAGALSPRSVPERSGLYLPTTARPQDDEPAAERTLADEVHERLPVLDWEELFNAEVGEDWIVEPLIPARRLVALYSPPKVGKSLLMLELAVHISRGTEVLGVRPDRPRRVLYVDFENDPRGDIRERLEAMGFGAKDLAELKYMSFPMLAALDTRQGGEQLVAAVSVYGAEVVVIDTISRAVAGEENENDTWLNFYRHTGRMLKAAGVALVRLDHTGKDETRGQRGGSAKSGDVDMVWRMSKVTDTTFRLDCEATRLKTVEDVITIHRRATPRLWHQVDAEGRYAAWRSKVDEVLAAADAAGLAIDAGRKTMRAWIRTTGLKASDAVLREVIKRRRGIDDDES